MDTSFNQTEFNLAYSDGVENNYWNIARNFILKNSILKNKLAKNNILEIGCGRGIVIKYLLGEDIKCFGIELADVKPIIDSNIITGKNAVEMSDDFKTQFETVMLLDVIEHIEKPVEFINEILSHYKNVKSLVITVPARQELWSNYDEYYGHFRRYDFDSMKKTISETGFEINELRYFFHSLYIPAKIVLKLFKNRKIKMEAPRGFGLLIHKIIGALMIIENAVLPSKWKGTSILCVASKK